MTSTEEIKAQLTQIGSRSQVQSFLKQNNWSIFKNHTISREDLQHLFNEYEILKNLPEKRSKTNDKSIQSIETLLLEKYKLATIEEIAKLLPHYADAQHGAELTAEEAIRYLIEDSKEDATKSHSLLGRLHPYLYENSEDQRKKLYNYCRGELKNDYDKLKLALESFILELGESANVSAKVKEHYDRYKKELNFLEGQRMVYCNQLEYELKTIEKYRDILDLWNKRETDENANLELVNRIVQDEELKNVYDEWLKWSEKPFIWKSADDCCKDDEVFVKFIEHINGTGLRTSKTYCKTMAIIFDVKLQFYENNSDHEIVVKEIVNPSSKNTVYVLWKETKFVQLRIDTDLFRLHQERLQKDLLYEQILSDIKLLDQRSEIDKYLHEKPFLNNHSLSSEVSFDVDYSSIFTYFPDNQRITLKDEFSKLTQEYIGHEGILYFLQNRFSCEGNHVSCKEMHHIISSILLYWEDNRKEKYTFAWLIAAFPQHKWTDELVLLRLENYFKKQLQEKNKWREYLSKIRNKEVLVLLSEKLGQSKSLTTNRVETVLHLLSNIGQGSFDLQSRDLSEWPYVLKEPYWLNKLEKLCSMQECDDLSAASYYVRSIENTKGFAWVESLLGLFALKITSETLNCETLTTILYYIHDETWNLVDSDLNELKKDSVNEWMRKMQRRYAPIDEERNISQLLELIKCNANCSERVKTNLPDIGRSIIEISRGKYESFTEKDIQSWKTQFKANMKKKKDAKELDELQEMLAVINRAVVLKRGFNLRDTQKLAVLALLANDHSILAQVSTGEGKSLIVVAAAIMKALFGEKVDIITSSSVLAKRDAENNNDIYSLFDITVSHNCWEFIDQLKQAYSVNQVVYGDLGSFQRDYLLDRFYENDILGDRQVKNVIVDEVDSMLVDKGNNMLYLLHDIPWMDKLESVYLFIWQQINCLEDETDDNVNSIEEAVLNDLYGMIREEDIAEIDEKLSNSDQQKIWSQLVNAKILDERGRLLIESVDGLKIRDSLTPELSRYTDRICFLLQATIERKRVILIPSYLRSFVERNLKQWINNAFTAYLMNPGHNYVVDVDRTGTSSDRFANIIILDIDTGTDQANSQWDEALHQFLQLKHDCKLSMLSLKAVFISNVSYFKLYTHLYGLTGTLGSQTDRDLLQEIHNVDFVTIPTSRTKQFREENPIVCCDSKEWLNSIRKQALLITEKKKRSALIICETVKDGKDVYKHFRANGTTNVHCYLRDYEVVIESTGDNNLDQGQIIIATNLAGRGTDIKITDPLRNAGGLHVLLTYLPSNKRIEEQAFGRAARCGDKGSGQLIIVHSEKCELHALKDKRDKKEMLRVSAIKSYYYSKIIAEEKCFNEFRNRYQSMLKELIKQKVPQEVQDILMQSCLDKWAFWLDENREVMTLSENKRRYITFEMTLNQLMACFESLSSERDDKAPYYAFKTDSWLPWVEGNPAQMIKLGTYLGRYESEFLTNSYDNSLKLLNDVILREPYFSEAAHYNKAFVIAKKINWESTEGKEKKKSFKRELQKAARLFEKHSGIATSAAGLITEMKQRANKKDSQCEDSEMKQCANKQDSRIDGYKEQKKHIANIYSTFFCSIDDVLGHCVTPESLQNEEIDHHLAEYEFDKLLDEGMLKKPKIKRENISEAIIRQIAKDYSMPAESLEKFLKKHSVDKMEKRNEFGEAKYNEERFGLDVDAFEIQLEKNTFLPGREKFWEILISKEILQDEMIYVYVDKQKQTTEEISKLVHQLEQRKDKEHTIECKLNQIVLYEEKLQGCQDLLVFKKDALDEGVYDLLEKGKLLSTNKRATVDVTDIEDVDLQLFDSISIDDFKDRANISEHDAKIILSKLENEHILKQSPTNQKLYTLKINFDEMPERQFLSCPLYEPVVKTLLEICFCYRLALQKIKRQLENQKTVEKKTPIRLELPSRVYRSLFFELVDKKVIEQVKVNNSKLVNMIKEKQEQKENTEPSKLYGTLEKLRGILKNPENLTVGFKPLKHIFGKVNFENIEEMRLFVVNGLEHVLHFERNTWTKIKIFFITAIIGLIAVAKMAIGTIIFSKNLYCSGINDLIYATGVWRTQTFSWEDYKRHTLRNRLLLARDVLTDSWKLPIGIKLLVPRFEYAINNVKTTAPATSNRKLLFGAVMDLPRVISTAKRELKTLCNAIEQEFISIVLKTLEDYNMSYNFEKYIDKLNYPKAWDTINGVIEDVLKESVVSEKYLPITTNIADFVTSGITNGISQLNIAENMINDIGTLCNPIRWIERITNLCEIRTVTNDLLEALKSNIESKFEQLNKQTEDQNTQTQTENNLEANSIEVWRRVDEQCNNILNKCVGHVVSQHVVTPIQKKCFDKMIRHIDSQMNTIS